MGLGIADFRVLSVRFLERFQSKITNRKSKMSRPIRYREMVLTLTTINLNLRYK